jgi:hypothetical protein
VLLPPLSPPIVSIILFTILTLIRSRIHSLFSFKRTASLPQSNFILCHSQHSLQITASPLPAPAMSQDSTDDPIDGYKSNPMPHPNHQIPKQRAYSSSR